jgi:hypothetical protein
LAAVASAVPAAAFQVVPVDSLAGLVAFPEVPPLTLEAVEVLGSEPRATLAALTFHDKPMMKTKNMMRKIDTNGTGGTITPRMTVERITIRAASFGTSFSTATTQMISWSRRCGYTAQLWSRRSSFYQYHWLFLFVWCLC